MTLKQILKIANEAYPDGAVHLAQDGYQGDTLALFIARELKDTYGPRRGTVGQLEDAANAIYTAKEEIQVVYDALVAEWKKAGGKEI